MGLFYWRSQRREKCAKNSVCLTPHGHWQKHFSFGVGRGWTWIYFEEIPDWRITAFKGTIKTFLKVVVVRTLGLIDALVALAEPTFLVRLSLWFYEVVSEMLLTPLYTVYTHGMPNIALKLGSQLIANWIIFRPNKWSPPEGSEEMDIAIFYRNPQLRYILVPSSAVEGTD
jgi:hypothetical protein